MRPGAGATTAAQDVPTRRRGPSVAAGTLTEEVQLRWQQVHLLLRSLLVTTSKALVSNSFLLLLAAGAKVVPIL